MKLWELPWDMEIYSRYNLCDEQGRPYWILELPSDMSQILKNFLSVRNCPQTWVVLEYKELPSDMSKILKNFLSVRNCPQTWVVYRVKELPSDMSKVYYWNQQTVYWYTSRFSGNLNYIFHNINAHEIKNCPHTYR